jgi:hypothetical protein
VGPPTLLPPPCPPCRRSCSDRPIEEEGSFSFLPTSGELDDHLLPLGKESVAKLLLEDDEDEVWPADGRVRPGSTKRKQYYEKKASE